MNVPTRANQAAKAIGRHEPTPILADNHLPPSHSHGGAGTFTRQCLERWNVRRGLAPFQRATLRLTWGLTLLTACAPGRPLAATPQGGVLCTADEEHPLRARCTAPAGPLEVELTDPDGQTTTQRTEGDTLIAWGLRASTAYAWRASGQGAIGQGELTTRAPPEGVAPWVEATGSASVDGVVFASCEQRAQVQWLDATGELVAYVDLPGDAPLLGIAEGEGERVLALRWPDEVDEVHPNGEVTRWLLDGVVPGPIHHDALLRGDRLWVLYAFPDGDVVVDGVAIVDRHDGLVATLDTRELFDVDGLGELEIDRYWYGVWGALYGLAHANALSLASDDTLAISLRDVDAIVAVDGDPASPGFGAVRWALEGTDGDAVDATIAWSDAGSFSRQHHVRLSENGLTLFDNGDPYTGSARGLSVDLTTGAARELAVWPMNATCPVQGSVVELADGGGLSTCAEEDFIEERGPEGDWRWRLEVKCYFPLDYTVVPLLSRALPFDFPRDPVP